MIYSLNDARLRPVCLGMAGLAGLTMALGAAAAEKPDWLSDASATVRETYDGNIFLSDVNAQYIPANYPLPAGSVAALKNKSSTITTVAPKFGVSLLPWTGTNAFSQFSLTYAPEFAIYQNEDSETHYDHHLITKLKGHTQSWTFGLDNNFAYVDGSRVAPTYPGGYVTAYNTAAPRDRRQQLQDRANVTATLDRESWFLRPGANLTYYDLQTEQINSTGYQNYPSRYDAHGGVDLGIKIPDHTALTISGQAGHQYQEKFAFSPYESSANYLRLLGGAEGKPFSWLTFKFQAGPDFRSYDSAAPVNNRNMITYYDEGSFAATLSANDTLTLEGRQFQWVSSVGKVPYFDTTASLTWHHRFSEAVGSDLGVKYLGADYRSGNLSTCQRYDTEYCFNTGLSYAVTRQLSLTMGAELDLGRNAMDGIADPSTRDFHRILVTFGTTWQF